MRVRSLAIVAATLVVSCQNGGGGGSSQPETSGGGGNGQVEEQADWSQPVHKCRSENDRAQTLAKVAMCLGAGSSRLGPLAHELQQLNPPQQDFWYSIWFDLKSVERRHRLIDMEVTCLKGRFCDPQAI